MTTKFRSKVCKSLLATDINPAGLIFDDCVVGGTNCQLHELVVYQVPWSLFFYEDDQGSSEIANSGARSHNDDYIFLETRGDSAIQAEEVLRIEELSIRPGVEKTIDICYTPFKEILSQDDRMCRLAKKNFRLNLSYSKSGKSHAKERILVQCVSRVCTSAILVSPEEIFLPFQEKLTVENVHNPENDQIVIVKSNIRQRQTSSLKCKSFRLDIA